MMSHIGTLMGVCHSASGALSKGDQYRKIQKFDNTYVLICNILPIFKRNKIKLINLKFNIDIKVENSLSTKRKKTSDERRFYAGVLKFYWSRVVVGPKDANINFPRVRDKLNEFNSSILIVSITTKSVFHMGQASQHVTEV